MITMVSPNLVIPPEVFEVLSQEQVQTVLENIMASARNHWIKLAGARLTSTRQDYLAGLQDVEFQPGVGTITLLGVLPNLLEQGMERTDLHGTLLGPNVPTVPAGKGLKGKHAKKGGGFYRAIPFRHSGPNANGINGQPMGSAYDGHASVPDAKKLGRQVYKQAKLLPPSVSAPGAKTKWGGRLPEGLAPKLKSHHAVDQFAGMVRLEKTYKKATQSSYMTFRTISTGSPGWIRPATPGLHFAVDVAHFVEQLAPQAFEDFIRGLTAP